MTDEFEAQRACFIATMRTEDRVRHMAACTALQRELVYALLKLEQLTEPELFDYAEILEGCGADGTLRELLG